MRRERKLSIMSQPLYLQIRLGTSLLLRKKRINLISLCAKIAPRLCPKASNFIVSRVECRVPNRPLINRILLNRGIALPMRLQARIGKWDPSVPGPKYSKSWGKDQYVAYERIRGHHCQCTFKLEHANRTG